jgi:hypothetical protein
VKLTKAVIEKFRSINEQQVIDIDPEVTVFVGMNEAGKTVFLKALSKSVSATGADKFNPVEDYPRKDFSAYMKKHASNPDVATTLTYEICSAEAKQINDALYTNLEAGFSFTVTHNFDNTRKIGIDVKDQPTIKALAGTAGLSGDASAAIKKAANMQEVVTNLDALELTDADKTFLAAIKARVDASTWKTVLAQEVWLKLSPLIPKFLYFSDYDILPGKLNLADLATRRKQAEANPTAVDTHLTAQHKSALALLRMADVDLTEISESTGYEEMKAKIEAVSISLTDQVLEFWKQNEDLEVEVDIKPDAKDVAPFNNGPNLYLRIKNRRHRGVSTPFDQRSRGFIWFFSFLVWFDSVQHQLNPTGKGAPASLILLLDEPGLALHALAQDDFLRYIDNLSKQHQVIYTTHSPFMVHSDRLNQVRVVEDKDRIGTTISANLSGSDPRTIFPLQAALGWTVAQNLFISKKNLLVEGPSELAYLRVLSSLIEAEGGSGLKDDVTIVPVGGLSNVVTFVSLLGANGLKIGVLHDYSGSPEQRLDDLVRQKLLSSKSVFNVSQFRDVAKLGENSVATDIEDLFDTSMYLEYFSKTYAKQLSNVSLQEADLPQGDRVVLRIEKYLADKAIKVRPSGGYNHYAVAAAFASSPPTSVSENVKTRFSAMFGALNKLY